MAKKNKTTQHVVLEVKGEVSMKRIDMYIDDDRSVYRGSFCKRDDASHLPGAMLSCSPVPR